MVATILHYTHIVSRVLKAIAMFLGGIMLTFGAWSLADIVITAIGEYIAIKAIIDISDYFMEVKA